MIKDLEQGAGGNSVFLCTQKKLMKTKANKPYLTLELQDRSGRITAKVWEVNGIIDLFNAGDAVFTQYSVTEYNQELQLAVTHIEKATPGTYRIEDLCLTTPYSVENMYNGILKLIQHVKDENLLTLLHNFFTDEQFVKLFTGHSAAVRIHHAFVGGLLQHTYSVARLSYSAGKLYQFVNSDLLITAALLHDIGKLHEISDFPENSFTDKGGFLGHVVEGQNMVRDACLRIPGFPQDLMDEICHCILAHHGQLEYGSPVRPVLVEAEILHFCDNLDARVEVYRSMFSDASVLPDKNGWYAKNAFLNTRPRRTIVQQEGRC